MMRTLALAVLLALVGCRNRSTPPATSTQGPNVRLHIEHAPGVPRIHIESDGGAGSIQIGAARAALPSERATGENGNDRAE